MNGSFSAEEIGAGHKPGVAGKSVRLDPDVLKRLDLLSAHVAEAVARRRRSDSDPDNPYRGLYLSDDQADALLTPQSSTAAVASGAAVGLPLPPSESRLARLATSFGLDGTDLDLLFVALAPDLEPRFEKLYGYLHDDLTRRRASVGLALELVGFGHADPGGRARLAAGSRLVTGGLLVLEETHRSSLTRPLRVPDRVIEFILGEDSTGEAIAALMIPTVLCALPEVDRLSGALQSGVSTVYLQDVACGFGASVAASALALTGLGALTVELTTQSLPPNTDDYGLVVAEILREARLLNRGLVVLLPEHQSGSAENVGTRDLNAIVVATIAATDWPTIAVGLAPWNPEWTAKDVFTQTAVGSPLTAGAGLWAQTMSDVNQDVLSDTTRHLRLRPDQIVRAAAAARLAAASVGEPIGASHIADAARSQNSAKLERLARRVRPMVTWSDLVLPSDVVGALSEIEVRYRMRDIVHGEWGLGGSNNRRQGVVALFAGPSGVGKTMAAEALAGALQLDLYQVNLATVVDKYIGETEKNLERIFSAAEGVNGVLLFDEADALFGKRSEVSDAKDRYANVEVAYLLQRLEVYEGVAVLATNLRTNIDDAFTRRLDAMVDFPEPGEEHRLLLWDRCLGTRMARSSDVDLHFLAGRFRLAGGNIRNITVAAAFTAVARDRVVNMADLVRATAHEYRKLGRLCTPSEFGDWHHLVA